MAGVDSSKISPSNPFEKSGMTAGLLQAAIAELDPAQAARWRVAAGGGLSVATMAELQSGEPLSAAAQRDLFEHDAKYVEEIQQQQVDQEAAQLKAFEEQAAQMRFNRELRSAGGNEHRAKRAIAAQDEQERQLAEQRAAWAQGGRV